MVGIDIVEVRRFENISRAFLERVFLPTEIAYLQSKKTRAETVAGMYAAKEAVLKAIGTGIAGGFLNVQIAHAESGAPVASLRGQLHDRVNGDLYVSISHSAENAVACCYIVPHGGSGV